MDTTCQNILTLVENEGAPTHARKLDSIFQNHKQQMFLLREIRAWHRFLENKTKKAECFSLNIPDAYLENIKVNKLTSK